jgi:hypothetical protein
MVPIWQLLTGSSCNNRYNLDWEIGNGSPVNHAYAAKFVSFVNSFKQALGGLSLSVDVIVSNIDGETFASRQDRPDPSWQLQWGLGSLLVDVAIPNRHH